MAETNKQKDWEKFYSCVQLGKLRAFNFVFGSTLHKGKGSVKCWGLGERSRRFIPSLGETYMPTFNTLLSLKPF